MVQSLPQAESYLAIEDHGIIGDLHTVALVGKNGTIDWCCIPAFDAPSVFGALLDAEKGGFFSIAPQDTPEMTQKQYYLPETTILITRFFTLDGVGEITDFMPIEHAKTHTKRHRIIRAVRVVRGSMTFELICRPAFNYARDTHTVGLSERGAVFENADLSLGLFLPSLSRKIAIMVFMLPLLYSKINGPIFYCKVQVSKIVSHRTSRLLNIRKSYSTQNTTGAPGSRSVATRAAGVRWCSGQP